MSDNRQYHPRTRVSLHRVSEDGRTLPLKLSTTRVSWRYLGGMKKNLMDKALQNASQIKKPTLIIQGEADDLAFLSGAKRLFESLAAEDKSLRTFPDADHWFYHAIFLKVTAKHDPEKREQVFSTVKDWLKTN